MNRNIETLEDQIQQLKRELILKVKETGLNSNDSLKCSQQLDRLITIYQRHLVAYIKISSR